MHRPLPLLLSPDRRRGACCLLRFDCRPDSHPGGAVSCIDRWRGGRYHNLDRVTLNLRSAWQGEFLGRNASLSLPVRDNICGAARVGKGQICASHSPFSVAIVVLPPPHSPRPAGTIVRPPYFCEKPTNILDLAATRSTLSHCRIALSAAYVLPLSHLGCTYLAWF